LEASTKFLQKAKRDKGLVKVVKGNHTLSAASLFLVLCALFGIGSPEVSNINITSTISSSHPCVAVLCEFGSVGSIYLLIV
jgi:hypothetical protein